MKNLTEKETEDLLEKEGFEVVARDFLSKKEQIAVVEKKIKYPWAMKVSSKKAVHKKKVGGVLLDIKNKKEAESAFDSLAKIDGFEGVVVQEMLIGSELILGIKKTPEFGQTIMIGKGGSNVEKEKDVSFRVLPISEKEADEMIKEIKFYKELEKKKVNFEKILENLTLVSKLTLKYKDISELDINPLIINAVSAKVIDARLEFEN